MITWRINCDGNVYTRLYMCLMTGLNGGLVNFAFNFNVNMIIYESAEINGPYSGL